AIECLTSAIQILPYYFDFIVSTCAFDFDFQEFAWEVVNKKGIDNTVADHLSRLEPPPKIDKEILPIKEEFSEARLIAVRVTPWLKIKG
ncbi:hypothetical protein ACH5RR_015563, partial [Cinchona calisaya]